MSRVDVFTTLPHYIDHVSPVWRALLMEQRGHVIIPEHLVEYAATQGMEDTWPQGERGSCVLVGGWQDAKSAYMWKNIILMEHGVGQSYVEDFTAYAGGPNREHVRLFLCPNERVADLNRKDGDVVVVGDPYLDELEKSTIAPIFDAVFTWHWDCALTSETRSAFQHHKVGLIDLMHKMRIAGTSHPRAWQERSRWYQDIGITSIQQLDVAIGLAHVFACDNSSAMYYAAALGKPVIVVNSPVYRRDVAHGLRFWEYADVGEQVDSPDQLESAVRELRDQPGKHALRATEICQALFPYRDGRSAERAAQAIGAIL